MFGRKKDVIGIDIGSSSIKLVEIKEVKKGYQLTNFGIAELHPETIVDGAIMDTAAVVDAIGSLVSSLKVKIRDVVTSVSGNAVRIQKISLPSMSKEELEESIQWEAEQYIPFDISDVNIDFQILDTLDDGSGQMEVILSAAKKDVINEYVAVISEAGLNVVIVDVDCFAIENMFDVNYQFETGDIVALVNIGASFTNINIMKNGMSAFTRDIASGGNQYTEELQKRFSISYDDAEALKLGKGGKNISRDDMKKVIDQVSGDLVASEIQKTIDYFLSQGAHHSINKVYLSGGTSKTPGLPKIIADKTGISIEIINPFANIDYNEKLFDTAYIQEIAPFGSVGVGLALRRVGDR
jgi:type IV pilus assembly protein PilM